ncbi:N-6 DNA methylase [Methylocella silvestris BL2]|uniref:site-specific DNA-methyltransferase (adenine-specific) n=1 Tax=Methylocella silvestris (strain DSM 15510 / CIP 108128 / LMG 27833 / NCIMB 13906 / BL2) TaxID=395965 RepID=B8EI18_METSB|nr:class I SAM-dependent DNA methyltransferase [Methylocella silvestris]ACK50500.1 N-6 DNA methylase [Methylocella silvestris BL2]
MRIEKTSNLGSFVWSIAEILRGDFKQSDYGKVILPFIVMRRLDCILEATKPYVLEAAKSLPEGIDDETRDMILFGAAGDKIRVYNTSRFTFTSLKGQDPGQVHDNLIDFITGFSPNVRDIFLDKFRFTEALKRLKDGGILWQVFERFCAIDLHPNHVSNIEMGYLFEDLIRRFSEISNETAGEHFTPREVIRLIVELLLANDHAALTGTGIIRTVYDPACGTGGMLALTEEAMTALNPKVRVELFGQELNGESFGICKSDMLVTGHNPEQIAFGNTLTEDAHLGKTFHYMLSNPPYGVDWKKYQDPIRAEHETKGFDGRFGPGLPRISDGQLLFLLHMISKMRDDEQGSRIGIVMNGSPLFTGGAGSGESEIRRWMLEKDWVEAIVAMPTDLFYNTGISTYVWLLNNRKPSARRGKVQLIDASSERFWKSMRKSLGSKRREIPEAARHEIVRIYAEMLNGDGPYGEFSKIVDREDFGYREIRIERPLRLNFQATPKRLARLAEEKAVQKLEIGERQELLDALAHNLPTQSFTNRDAFEKVLTRALKGVGGKIGAPLKKAILSALSERDESADICLDANGKPESDTQLRDHELVPLNDDWRDFVAREVTPFVPDAWVDENYRDDRDGETGRVAYEINFNRYFYKYVPPRPLAQIDCELKQLEAEIAGLLKEVAA